MKKILAILSTVVLVGVMTGCKDYLDINDNPNYLTTSSPEGLLTSAEVYTGAILGGDVQLVTSYWNQYYTQNTSNNQYWTIVRNNLSYASSYFSYIWNQYYLYAIPNAREIQKLAAEKNESYEYSYGVVAKVLEAFDWYILNSFFDQIAYTHGMDGENDMNPEFDSSENSYKIVVGLFEDLLVGADKVNVADAQDASDGVLVGTGRDYIFDGDMYAWMQFANTIYLKLLMRDFTANQSKIEAALANGYGFIDEYSGPACLDIFVDLASKSNPLYESDRRQLNTDQNIRGCNSIMNILNTNGDPRIEAYYEGYTGANYSAGGSKSRTARAALGATDPVYLVTVADAYLTQAEALYRLGETADAKAAYDKGVEASFEMWGLDGTSFVDAGGAYEFNAATVDEAVEAIITQKWLAGVRCNAWDSWFDLNRTGYPEYGTVLQDYSGYLGSGEHPRRFMYPQRSALYNVNAPETVGLGVKMWWHK